MVLLLHHSGDTVNVAMVQGEADVGSTAATDSCKPSAWSTAPLHTRDRGGAVRIRGPVTYPIGYFNKCTFNVVITKGIGSGMFNDNVDAK